ncbi:MAG: metal/formaldehyde-sensitive transcriptional repressor [Gemmatimonadaceae bacterium]
MAHIVRDKTKLLNRVRRIRGQVDAIERTLDAGEDDECTAVMQLIAATRGAMDGLMASVLEGHVRFHMIDPDRNPTSREARAAQELIDVVNAYLK